MRVIIHVQISVITLPSYKIICFTLLAHTYPPPLSLSVFLSLSLYLSLYLLIYQIMTPLSGMGLLLVPPMPFPDMSGISDPA